MMHKLNGWLDERLQSLTRDGNSAYQKIREEFRDTERHARFRALENSLLSLGFRAGVRVGRDRDPFYANAEDSIREAAEAWSIDLYQLCALDQFSDLPICIADLDFDESDGYLSVAFFSVAFRRQGTFYRAEKGERVSRLVLITPSKISSSAQGECWMYSELEERELKAVLVHSVLIARSKGAATEHYFRHGQLSLPCDDCFQKT